MDLRIHKVARTSVHAAALCADVLFVTKWPVFLPTFNQLPHHNAITWSDDLLDYTTL